MKHQIKTIKRLLVVLALLSAMFSAMFSTASAQDAEPITLVPFENETYGIQGVIPEGWTQLAPGVHRRGSSLTDAALIAQQAAPLAADALLTSLLPQLGLTEAPESVGTHETAAFTWTLYRVDVTVQNMNIAVDVALAEADGTSYVVLLQMEADEYDTLHEAVFIPVLDALAPLDADAEAESVDYIEEDVTVESGEATLACTLSLPSTEGEHPAVVLLTGSGSQDRDESLAPVAAIKPFKLIADHLTPLGIAVLRCDDRGVGGSTLGGDPATLTMLDLVADASAMVDFLADRDDINGDEIGLFGHSEGGGYAPQVAVENENVAFVITMAGPTISGQETLLTQNERILQVQGLTEDQIAHRLDLLTALFDAVLAESDVETVGEALRALALDQISTLPEDQQEAVGDPEAYVDQLVADQAEAYLGEAMYIMLTYNPYDYLTQLDVPLLALFGDLDVQVDADQNAAALEAAVEESGNEDVTIVRFPAANHLFQEATTGGIEEYGSLPAEFTADFLSTISDWLLERVTVVE